MITGIETAALALAVLPLVISALEHYNDGLTPIKNFFRYKGLIQELVDDLKLQTLLLRNTCEQLLTGVVESDTELAELLDNPTSSSWKREALVSALRKRLQYSYDTFVELGDRLMAALGSLTSRIGLDSDGQPRWVDAKSRKQYWKRFSNCLFHKEHEALLARMAKDNQNLKYLVQDSLQLEPVRSKTQKRRTEVKYHKRSGLVTQIDSQSNPVQSSMLRHPDEQHRNLNGQNVATQPAKTAISKSDLSASLQRLRHSKRKRVAWAVVPGIQVASVQLTNIPNPPSSDEPRIIDDLCHSLRSTNECEENSCVGRLEDEESSYSIYAVSRCAYQDVDATNLYELLSQNQGPSTAVSNRLTRKIRLQLAVILASTALQLHTTPWLDSSWNGKIINFHQGALNHPYISKVFTKATPTQPVEKTTLGPVRNQTLFALGILLLELSTGKPLDSFKDPQNSGPFEEFVTASQVLQAISEEESLNYYEAAQACIFCNFRGSAKDLNLANDAFRQAFYEDVVVPLEEDLKYYCRA
ncbi:MAG: hypothetical protein Q9204_003802 [Flavoplaca sp. TL-2023a]